FRHPRVGRRPGVLAAWLHRRSHEHACRVSVCVRNNFHLRNSLADRCEISSCRYRCDRNRADVMERFSSRTPKRNRRNVLIPAVSRSPDDIALRPLITLVLPSIAVLRLARSWSCLRFDDAAKISCPRLHLLWFPMAFLQSRSETLSQSGRVETVSRWLWFCLWSLQVRLVSRLRLAKPSSPQPLLVKQSLQGNQLQSENRSREASRLLLGMRPPSERRSHEARRLLLGMQLPSEGTLRQAKPLAPGS